MMIKGCLLALVISSTYAAEDKPNGGGANRPRNGVRTYSGPNKAGGSNSGNGRTKVAANMRWGNRRRKPMPGRIRRRKPRPANWVRPSRPANRQAPTESERYDSGESYGESYDDYTDGGDDYTDNGYDECDAQLRSTCCDLPDGLSVQEKINICYAVGCDYDKCDWSDDGYETLEPTSEPTWSADGWQRDGWNDDGHNVCLAADQAMCCNLPASISDYKKMSLCDKLGCDYDQCDWSDDGWKHDTDEPTSDPTSDPTSSPTITPTGNVCNIQSRDICCNQSDKLSVVDKKRVCDRLGCMYKKCGWKRDGYDDDDSEPAWKSDGYSNDYDDKYDDKHDVDYNTVKDLYDEQWNYKENKNGGNDYKDDSYGNDDDKYDHVNDYDDDKCTSEERRVCCTANQKKQWKVCNILGCNMRKCDKRDWDDDGGYDANDNNKVRYNNKIPTARPTWRNSPYYMNGYNQRPTLRPTYRTYSTNTGHGYGYQGGSYAPPVYNPYAPAIPYNPYTAPEPADSTWQGDAYDTGYKAAEPDDSWAGDSYKKYKKEKPSASPTQTSAPSVSLEPSMSPSVSIAPSESIAPSKAKKKPKGYGGGGGGYKQSYTKKYDQDMKTMKEDLQELKQLLQMSIAEEVDEDDTATEAAYAETNQLKDELAQIKLLIAEAYVKDEVGEEDTDYLETTLSEVEAEVAVVEEVLEKKVKKEKAEKVEAEVVEVEEEPEAKKAGSTEKTDKKKKGK